MKFGSDLRIEQYDTSSQGVAAAGQFNVSPLFTDANPLVASSSQTSGSSAASLLLGLADSGSLARTAPLSLRHTYLGLFVQDTWRRDRLTVTVGLRYEVETPYTERDDQVAFGFDPSANLPIQVPGYTLTGGLQFAGVEGKPRREGHIDPNNFGPRVGATYHLTPKTVVRGGYGLFLRPDRRPDQQSRRCADVQLEHAVRGRQRTAARRRLTTISNPFPNGIVQPLGSTPGVLAQVGNSLSFVNPDRVAPYTHQWQVSVQRELPASTIVEVAYVGMLSRGELESYNLNDIPAAANIASGATQVPNPFFGIFPATSTLGASRTVAARSLQVAFPQFTTLTEDGLNVGESNYHAVSARVEKRLSHGFSAIGSYSFSHLVHNNVTSLVNTAYFHSDTVDYRSISALDQPHLFRARGDLRRPGPVRRWRIRVSRPARRARRLDDHQLPDAGIGVAAEHHRHQRPADHHRRSRATPALSTPASATSSSTACRRTRTSTRRSFSSWPISSIRRTSRRRRRSATACARQARPR